MRLNTPIDGWSAYYALLTEALSAPPRATACAARTPRRSLFERLDHWFASQRGRANERYLAQSANLCELESRMRELDRHY